MMMRIGFFIIIALCTMSHGLIYSQSGLGALLQQTGIPSPAKSATLTKSTKTVPAPSGLSTLLASSKTSPSSVPVDTQSGLFQEFTTMQSNPLYTKAMHILSNASLQAAYSNTLLSIQLFFMQYATQDLNKLSEQSQAKDKLSLSSLLSAAVSKAGPLDARSGVEGLSLLLSHVQSAGQLTTKKDIKTSVTGLVQQLRVQHKVAPIAQSSKTGLENLLDAVHATTKPTVDVGALPIKTAEQSKQSKGGLSMLLGTQG